MNLTDTHKKLAAGAVLLMAVTWWAATAPESPIRPKPPRPDRPVLRFIGKLAIVAAKFGLGALVFLEPPPPDADEVQLSHAALGSDGHQMLRNEVW
ncbi:MAG: hypothetical protein EBR82_67170 [Caulobacteraceae bacterium]|nr:hypothetical protein [Caulobacteraceae bacterium]